MITGIFKVFAISLIAACVAMTSGCSSLTGYHLIPAFHVTVVDADTGEPLEGVVMLAFWSLERSNWIHGYESTGQRAVKESISGADGKLGFPLSTEERTATRGSVNDTANPGFRLYKDGYKERTLFNVTGGWIYHDLKNKPLTGDGTARTTGSGLGLWNNKIVKLERLPDGYDLKKLYLETSMRGFRLDFDKYEAVGECAWESYPGTLISGTQISGYAQGYTKKETLERIRGAYNKTPYCNDFEAFRERYKSVL